jgi:hypothetical protein
MTDLSGMDRTAEKSAVQSHSLHQQRVDFPRDGLPFPSQLLFVHVQRRPKVVLRAISGSSLVRLRQTITYQCEFGDCRGDENVGSLHREHLTRRLGGVDHRVLYRRRHLPQDRMQPVLGIDRPVRRDRPQVRGHAAMVEETFRQDTEYP